MDWTAIYNRSLRLSHTNSADYTTSQASEDLNLRYQDLIDRITNVTKGDYFWDLWETDTVVNQSEYVVEKLGISPDDLDIKKINKVFVKYQSTDTYYTRLNYVNPNSLENHPDYYKANQPEIAPFFYIQDNSIFIYPAPEEVVTNGLQIFCIHKPADITTSTSEDDIELPAQFHRILVLGMVADVYYSQGKINEANDAENKYEDAIRDMEAFMKARYNQPRRKTFTKLNEFR